MDPNDATFQFAVNNEMIAILNELYSTMNVSNPLTLEDIQRTNPQLFNQIRQEAEVKAREMLSSRSAVPQSAPRQMGTVSGGKRPVGTAFPSANIETRARTDYHSRMQPEMGSRGMPHATIPPQQHIAVSSSGTFVNGYVWEQPVLIDIDRAKDLTNSLENKAATCADVSPVVCGYLRTLLPRMQRYLGDVMAPPPLPGVLNGE